MSESTRRRAALALVSALGLAWLSSASAQAQIFRYMAFGDSITKGRNEFDPTGQGGYPGRLDDLLSCFPPDCEVKNEGKDAEKTSAGITRLLGLLTGQAWDVVLLMEGTNDVFNNISNNSIEANLATMDANAADAGVDTLHASIIHLDPGSSAGMNGSMVSQVASLRNRVSSLAASRNRWFADPWTRLCPDQTCFDTHYHNPPGFVGHPDPSGFDELADVFRDEIVSEAIPGTPSAISPSGTISDDTPTFTWNKEGSGTATFYHFRLLEGATTVYSRWHEEGDICSGSQCNLQAGTFADGDYVWEVRGRNPNGRSGYSSLAVTILTTGPPGLVRLTAPLLATGDAEPTFKWLREEPVLAEDYRVEVSDDNGVILDTTVPFATGCSDDACGYDLFDGSPLTPGLHTWRVQGSNAAGVGSWTEEGSFLYDPDVLFADGFETGDASAWSMTHPE